MHPAPAGCQVIGEGIVCDLANAEGRYTNLPKGAALAGKKNRGWISALTLMPGSGGAQRHCPAMTPTRWRLDEPLAAVPPAPMAAAPLGGYQLWARSRTLQKKIKISAVRKK